MNGKVEVTWGTLQTIAHSIMVHARFIDKSIHFALMYTTDIIFPVISIKHWANQDRELAMPHKLATGTKPSVTNLHDLFFPCVVRKATEIFYTKALNMRHQPQKGFRGVFITIPQHQKGYLIYIPCTQKIVFHIALYLMKYFLVI